jgi:hypothetical protein
MRLSILHGDARREGSRALRLHVSCIGIGEDTGAALPRELRGHDLARALPHAAELCGRRLGEAAQTRGDGGDARLDRDGAAAAGEPAERISRRLRGR